MAEMHMSIAKVLYVFLLLVQFVKNPYPADIIVEYIAKIMRKPEMDFLILETCLSAFSEAVKNQLNQLFLNIGVEVYDFVIGNFQIPKEQYAVIEEGQYNIQSAIYVAKIKKIEAKGEAEIKLIQARAKAQSRDVEGYNWADEQIAETAKIYASNAQIAENPANMLAQAPMVMAFGNMLRENMEPVLDNSFSNPPLNFHDDSSMSVDGTGQNSAMSDMEGSGFGWEDVSPLEDVFSPVNPEEGKVKPVQESQEDTSMKDFERKMKKLRIMLDTGIITQEEFEAEKAENLKNL